MFHLDAIMVSLVIVFQEQREYDWLLTALIYGLIGCFRSKLSDYKQSDRPNQAAKQPIKIKLTKTEGITNNID